MFKVRQDVSKIVTAGIMSGPSEGFCVGFNYVYAKPIACFLIMAM